MGILIPTDAARPIASPFGNHSPDSIDIANRLADVDGVPYVYDANGNLLSDGQNTYAYDSVGNRLTQESMVNGLSSTVNYAYDSANRLTSVDGVNYTFDANGNLLSDGQNTYAYDSANRLTAISG